MQKYILEQHDVVQLFQELLSRLPTTEFELFLVSLANLEAKECFESWREANGFDVVEQKGC